MSRLPATLQPAWPLVKRLHRWATRLAGVVVRRTSQRRGNRALPARATELSAATAQLEPQAVTLHPGGPVQRLDRTPPIGDPDGHWIFATAARFDVPPRFTLEVRDGLVVGEYGANITPGGILDFETSEYFGIRGWREHPLYLRAGLPPVERLDGSLVSLATRGGGANYYHFLLDVLPRWGILQESCPHVKPDHVHVPSHAGYHRELLALVGLDAFDLVAPAKNRAVSADRVLVPSLPNPHELAPPWTVDWLRARLIPKQTSDKPRHLYVTRGSGPNTRRLVGEPELWPILERRGFVRIDPGQLSVRDQIDHFAAADVIVGLHGAALSNLVFVRSGTRVLEISAPTYTKSCYWAICESIADVTYQYLIGEGKPRTPGREMNDIQRDIELEPARLEAALERLMS